MDRDPPSGEGEWLPEFSGSEPSPEQVELALKRAELIEVNDEASEREMKLTVLRAQLDAFAHDRVFRLGPLYVRIDELKLQVAQLLLAGSPEDPVLQRRVQEAGARVAQSKEDACEAAEIGPTNRITLTPEMKTLYHAAARRMHPDLGRTDEDVALRHGFMVRLNAAYRSGDTEGIQDVMAAWEAQSPPPESLDVAEDLVRVIRVIHRLRRTIKRLAQQVADLRTAPEHKLMIQERRAAAEGVDLFADMKAKLVSRIERLEQRVRDLEEGKSE